MNYTSRSRILAIFLLLALSVTVLLARSASSQSAAPRQKPTTSNSNYRLSGPYTHKNLTIFLVHGKELLPGKNFLTLQEALAQKKVVVYETKDVNELAIRNLSNQDVYVQSGDVVRGGEQDRMISIDFIVPPRSRRIPIAAFCVESDRWEKRGKENPTTFSSSDNGIATKELKLAAKRSRSQSEVWETVKVAQEKISANTGVAVLDVSAPSSYEMAVSNSVVVENGNEYVRALSNVVRNKPDVIGYVFAINGHVNSADVYASRPLFLKLWPKLLRASAVEAIAELNQAEATQPVTNEVVHTFLADSERGAAKTQDVTHRVKVVTREDDLNIFFETQDNARKGAWVHRNYIRKQ
jgi:ARG/rhodanese/phosphatase superfamily protein